MIITVLSVVGILMCLPVAAYIFIQVWEFIILKAMPAIIIIGFIMFMAHLKAKPKAQVADRAPQSIEKLDPRAELVKGSKVWGI